MKSDIFSVITPSFNYSVHTRISGNHRIQHAVDHVTQFWPGRIR